MYFKAVGSSYYFNTEGPYTVTLQNGSVLTASGQTVLSAYDPGLLRILRAVYPCNNPLIDRCQYKDCSMKDFVLKATSGDDKKPSNCDTVGHTAGTLSDCAKKTCRWDGNTFTYRFSLPIKYQNISGAMKCNSFIYVVTSLSSNITFS